jgi:Bacterial Ig domain/Putative peptidoglycan binding domain
MEITPMEARKADPNSHKRGLSFSRVLVLAVLFLVHSSAFASTYGSGTYGANNYGAGDITPPTVSLTAPSGGSTVSGASVALSATASDDVSVAGVQFKLDTNTNIGAEDTTSTYGITWNSTAVADGNHTIVAVARDTSNNYATSSAITVTVDNTAPVRSAGSPSGTLTLNTTGTTLALTTNEAATCKYSTSSGTAYGSMTAFTTIGSTSHSKSVSGLANGGSYVYYVKCQDGQSNTNATDYTISFTVAADTTSPTVTVTAPLNNSTVSGNAVAVSADATDDVSVSGVQFKLDTNTNIGSEDISSPYALTWDSTGVADGIHTIVGVARDGSGNYATSSIITITVQNAGTSSGGSSGGGSIGLGGGGGPAGIFALAPPTITTIAPTSNTGGLSENQIQSILLLVTAFGADQATINNINAVLHGQATQPSAPTLGVFPRDLELNSTGDDVRALQHYLNTHGFQLANYGVGSLGNETDYFGNATRYQLIQFQKAAGITPAVGYFGPRTRAVIVR